MAKQPTQQTYPNEDDDTILVTIRLLFRGNFKDGSYLVCGHILGFWL